MVNQVMSKIWAMGGSIITLFIAVKPDKMIEAAILAFIGAAVGLITKKLGDLLWKTIMKKLKK